MLLSILSTTTRLSPSSLRSQPVSQAYQGRRYSSRAALPIGQKIQEISHIFKAQNHSGIKSLLPICMRYSSTQSCTEKDVGFSEAVQCKNKSQEITLLNLSKKSDLENVVDVLQGHSKSSKSIYSEVVKECIKAYWLKNSNNPQISDENLKSGYEILVSVALHALSVDDEKYINKKRIKFSIFDKRNYEAPQYEPMSDVDKVKSFINNSKCHFTLLCENNFPFSTLDLVEGQRAYRDSLESYETMLMCLLKQHNTVWLNEDQLNLKYESIINCMSTRDLEITFYSLSKLAQNKNEVTSKFYLLWFLKKISGKKSELPSMEVFMRNSSDTLLANFIAPNKNSKELLTFAAVLLEKNIILNLSIYSSTNNLPFHSFLRAASKWILTLESDSTPYKYAMILEILNHMDDDSIHYFAAKMRRQKDKKVVLLGKHILPCVNAKSHAEAKPHFDILSNIEHVIIYKIPRKFNFCFDANLL